MDRRQVGEGGIRKRKADTNETNERLHKVSKRLSQLNLERNGQHLDVANVGDGKPFTSTIAKVPTRSPTDNDQMRLDDTPNKVYIYNLDDELSDSESEEGKIIFLPDIEKRLLNTRIPASVLANKDGELAGRNIRNELVLYNVPISLTVPEGRDSVRKAIIETRARAREKQRLELEAARIAVPDLTNGHLAKPTPMGESYAFNGAPSVIPNGVLDGTPNGSVITEPYTADLLEDDPDAMDLS